MRILSVRVQDYRVHRDLEVELDAARTVVGGPNESGKSTLAEAIHRALFLRHSVGGTMHEAMRSAHGGGMPEVTLRFEAGGRAYTLHKRFAGARGSTARLSEDGGAAWRDDEAETRLAALLGVEEPAGGRSAASQLQGQWAHLLAWQGDSPGDPLKASEGQHARLLQRLQGGQGAVVQQSPLDEQVAGEVERLLGEHRTERGARAGGPLHAAQRDEQEGRAARAAAEGELEARAQALDEFATARRELEAAEASLAALQPQREALARRQAEVDRLRPLERDAARVASESAAALARLQAAEAALAQRRARVRELEEQAAPLARQVATCLGQLAEAEAAQAQAAQAQAQAGAQFEACWARDMLAKARMDELQGEQRVLELQRQQQALEQHQQRVEDLKARLAALAPVTPQHLRDLERHVGALNEAQAALAAMAAGIEVLEAPGPVHVGPDVVAAGQSRVVTEATEVRTPGGVRLRIQPGGGNVLAEARARVAGSEHALRTLLLELGLASRDEALQVASARDRLEAQLDQLQDAGPGVDAAPEELAQQLAGARAAVLEAQAEAGRRAAALRPGEELPGALAQAEAWQRGCASEVAAAQAAMREAQQQQARADARVAASRARVEQATLGQRTAGQQLDTERAVLDHELGTHGDDVARAQRLAQARGEAGAAQERLAALRAELAEQRPDTLEGDHTRLARAQQDQEARRQAAAERRLRSEGALQGDGRRDLAAAASLARAAHEAAGAALARVQRRVAALDLLAQAFATHREQLVAQYTQPLVDQVQHYARCVFGAQALPVLAWDEEAGAFGSLRLARGMAHDFESLSMGAREQLGVAVRLAIAKVLAQAHGGCLPVVLDDAFSHSDEDRVERLLAMLDLAAQDGLQVIVLTCRPDDYAALGARRVDLPRVVLAPPAASVAPGGAAEPALAAPEGRLGAPAPGAGSPAQGAAPGDEEALLAAVRAAGGSAGNGALRNGLGWDEPRYAAARQALLASGRVVVGAGRGGSLRVVA